MTDWQAKYKALAKKYREYLQADYPERMQQENNARQQKIIILNLSKKILDVVPDEKILEADEELLRIIKKNNKQMKQLETVLFKTFSALCAIEDSEASEVLHQYLEENKRDCGWEYNEPLSKELLDVCQEVLNLDID